MGAAYGLLREFPPLYTSSLHSSSLPCFSSSPCTVPLYRDQVIVELTAHLGAGLGYLLAQVRGWNARTTSRVLALLTCMSVAALEVGYLLGTRQLHNIPAWAIGTYLTCTALAGYATWGIDRGFKVAEQRGWDNCVLAIPGFSSL